MRAPTISQFRRSFGSWIDGLPGKWKGDAYCYHPHGVIARPMVYTDHHNVSGACDAHVMTDPEAKFKPRGVGREASLGNSGLLPNPKPESGELVMVYRNGDWVGPDGPWRAQMRRDMANTLWSIRTISRRLRQEREQAERERQAELVAKFEAAALAFKAA
jgi:hypothetical protein